LAAGEFAQFSAASRTMAFDLQLDSLGFHAVSVRVRKNAPCLPPTNRATRAARLCYAYVMAIKRITLSVPEQVAVRLKKAAGRVPISAWVTQIIEQHLQEAELEAAWQAFLRDAAPSRAEARQADAMFQRLTQPVASPVTKKGKAA